jgi:hypothetical protein
MGALGISAYAAQPRPWTLRSIGAHGERHVVLGTEPKATAARQFGAGLGVGARVKRQAPGRHVTAASTTIQRQRAPGFQDAEATGRIAVLLTRCRRIERSLDATA